MVSRQKIYLMFKSKQIYSLFLCMLLSFQILKANQPIMALDSLALVQQQDSIARVEHIQDSLNFQYVAVDSLAPNYFLDSLRNVVTVSDNDFVGWINLAPHLGGRRGQFFIHCFAHYHSPKCLALRLSGFSRGYGKPR